MTAPLSAGPTGNGDDLNSYTLTPTAGSLNVDLPGTSYAVSLAVSSTHGYVAQYADNSGVGGQFVVVDLTTGSTGTPLSGVTGVRAIAVANFLVTPLIFVATTESGAERLRVYQQSGLTPTLLFNTKLTGRANALTVGPDTLSATNVMLYVSQTDRFSTYRYVDNTTPLMMTDTVTVAGGASFFQSVVASNGTVVVAAGRGGVLAIQVNGNARWHSPVSGLAVAYWRPGTAYTANTLVKPQSAHPFSGSRYYFTCSTAGTSASAEPAWASSGTMIDNTAQWQPVGLVDGVATGVALDEINKRIYAVGVAGGDLGTAGRVWMFRGNGVL